MTLPEIVALYNEAKRLQQTGPKPDPTNLFDPLPNYELAVQFFGDVLCGINFEKNLSVEQEISMKECMGEGGSFQERLANTPTPTGSLMEIFRELNSGSHPIRNGLILQGVWRSIHNQPNKTN